MNLIRNVSIGLSFILTLPGCGQADREAKIKQLPGYQVASETCGKCHPMPYPPDRPAAAWSSIVNRMEGLMRNKGYPAQDQATHDSIVRYFEAGAKM
jgi:hypothetical protein